MPDEKAAKTKEPWSTDPEHSELPEEFSPWEAIWTQPPTLLPGPENHPFFAALWANELPKFLNPYETPDLVQEATSTDVSAPVQSSPEKYSLPPSVDLFRPPMVYPFVPTPTLSMLLSTPEAELEQHLAELAPAVSPPISTPGLSISSTNQGSSPRSRPSTSSGEQHTVSADQEQPATSEHKVRTEYPFDPTCSESEASFCQSTYMRALPNETTSEPAVIINGQIWRSSNKKKKGWRRNQWVVDVR